MLGVEASKKRGIFENPRFRPHRLTAFSLPAPHFLSQNRSRRDRREYLGLYRSVSLVRLLVLLFSILGSSMGNGTGMFQVGAVFGIEVLNNHEPHVGGSEIRGKVFMQVDKSSVSALALNVKLGGYEQTKVTYTEHHGSGKNRRTVTKHAYQNAVLVQLTEVLCQYPTAEVHQGRYDFPFAFTLPMNLPGSQGAKAGRSYFVIKYYIEVELVRPASIMNAAVRNAVELFVLDTPAVGIEPSAVPSQRVPVYFMCCHKTGSLQLAANVGNVNLALGEQVDVSYSVQNFSTSRIKAVDVSVVESVSGVAQGHRFGHITAVYSNRLDAANIAGAMPLKQRPDNQVAAIDTLSPSQLQKITVPVCGTRPSRTGIIGGVTHVLRIMAVTTFGTANITIDIPLKVHGTRGMFQHFVPEVEVPLQRPADWQTTVPIAFATPVGAVGVDSSLYSGLGRPSAQAGTAEDVRSLSYLLQQLQSSNPYMETMILREWLAKGGARSIDLSPSDMQQIFSLIRQDLSYEDFAQEIGRAWSGKLTAHHVAAASRGVPDSHKSRVCIAFSKHISDKSQVRSALMEAGLPEGSLDMVLMYYNV